LSLFSSLLFLNSCTEEIPLLPEEEVVEELTPDQLEMKVKLDDAAKLLSQFVNEPEIHKEISQLSYLNNEFNKLSFKNLMDSDIQTKNGKDFNFSNLKNELTKSFSIGKDGGEIDDLLEYLISNNCYIYVPYSQDWYPENQHSYTVAAHPIDNDDEGVGYRNNNNGKNSNYQQVMVDELYAEDSPVVIIMPSDPDLGGGGNNSNPNPVFGTFGSGTNSMHTVYIGYVRLADYCGGIFEGDIELRIKRIQPYWNSVTNSAEATEPVELHINYPREYAKAAVNDWNVYCNGGWLKVNSTWDTNWSTNEDQQGIIAYDYDWNASIKKTSVALTYKGVGFTVSFDRDTKYEGDFLGKNNEWWRDWFYATNQNPTPFDEVKYGYTVRSLGSLKFTTPTYTLYY